MNWLPIVINFLVAILVIVSLLIILLVLMQRPKNEGLGAAFGGGMTENLFGAQTTNVLQTVTRYLGGIFFALTLLLSWLYVKKSTSGGSTLQQRLSAPTVIPATPAPATPAPDDKLPLPDANAVTGSDGKAQPPPPGLSIETGVATGPVKVMPLAPGSATPAPAVPGATKPAPAPGSPDAAKPESAPAPPAEKPAEKPPQTPAAPGQPGN
jgi:preprotein translocase subunit SecG